MKFIPGRGAASRKFAAWANKVHSGSLGKYIQPSRGMQVLTTGEIGVSLAATGPDVILFKLSDPRPVSPSTPVSALVCGPTGSVVGSTSTDVYFSYTKDYYGDDHVVLCQNVMGQWEVFSPGASVTRGTAGAAIAQGATGTINLSTSIGSTSSITATSEMFSVESGDLVYARYISGVWYLDAVECPA